MSVVKNSLVIIPTYNESKNIEALIDKIIAISNETAGLEIDVLVVDDYSPDGTAKIVEQLNTLYPGRIKISSGPKKGLGRAYIRGFNYALRHDYDSIVMMDADFSHQPRAILSLLSEIKKGADYVIGSRYMPGGRTHYSWPIIRRVQSRLANFLAKQFSGLPNVHDFTGGFKAIRHSALKEIDFTKLKASGYVFQVELLYLFWMAGFKIHEVPIVFNKRRYGSSKMRISDVTEFISLTYRLNPDSPARRLIRFGFVGAIGTFVNLGALVLMVEFFKASPLVAVAIAIEASIINNFFFNHFYTFRLARQKHLAKETPISMLGKLLRYNLVALGGASITYLVFILLFKVVGIHYILSDLIAIIAAISWNYFMSVRVVWNLIDKSSSS